MAIIIEANYSKKLGLPAYSSHSYSVTIRSEVADLTQVDRESSKLYAILQGSVDRQIQEVGCSARNLDMAAVTFVESSVSHAGMRLPDASCCRVPRPRKGLF